MLFPTPALGAEDQRVLGEIDDLRHSLRLQVRSTPTKWTDGLRKFLTADAVAASNSIEGFKVSTVDVEDLLEGERDVDVSEEDREETLAFQRMMTYIQTLHDVADFRYGKEFLNALHWMLQGHRHTPRKPAGQWRRGAVYVTDVRDPSIAAYTAPDAVDVPALTGELVEWLNADDGSHPLIRAAMAHLHLVSIHPWADGNGRMSRSLQTLMIAREGELAPEFSSIEAWLGRPGNTWEYYRELQRRGATYRPDQDVSGWVRFNLTAYHQQAQTVRSRLDRSSRVWVLLGEFVEAGGLEERVVSALHDVAMSGRVRRTRYERAEDLSLQRAQRDLRDLAAVGVLTPVGRTRARFYTAGSTFPDSALEAARTPLPLADPYAR
ncbi:Fic family protein [Streptomyces turgidiscabies]|uniref:Toxin-antitoxin system, toxin component, Fic family n=1 Tax=Streptomyces turgidiscabies (strain Car8) TaxID=698760 RepID=L7F6F5_STRT8|nr:MULTISPECIES: Fic family protein [Streptomyces]ELP67148.1 toxin-antitoxin system, toxin component, Fic family [Streptomyces turgidiscabies Car8]MDX3493139.1 Fic family protein [Streptomyces turgidiscabies]GAQ70436.1 adenosine monophosphate-protein transferase [Streptomyces turgidiscabies]